MATTNKSEKERLESIIAEGKLPKKVLDDAAVRLGEINRLESVGQAQVLSAVNQKEGVDPAVVAILETLQKSINSGGGKVNMNDVRKAINEELSKRKLTEDDLSKSLLAFIQSQRKVSLTIGKLLGMTVSTNASAEILNLPLMQLILSDVIARNNAYLYGGAGTGKTWLAEELADLLGWEKIILNCNQFTSPIDILGGQTIDGYQEGKLSMAWGNYIVDPNGLKRPAKGGGCVLILDELPKIDPNTAGILNQALAKVKDFKKDENGNWVAPTIRNGRNVEIQMGNIFIIATGNVPLNEIDPDYEANFKQDLSLQDRFVGSTYKVGVNVENEAYNVMRGFAFIWLFLMKVRKAVITNRALGQAFVSMRIMINAKATYCAYRDIKENSSVKKGNVSSNAIANPKTLITTFDDFFNLFKKSPKENIIRESDYEGFKRILLQKDSMPYNETAPNFDTPQEIAEIKTVIRDYYEFLKNN